MAPRATLLRTRLRTRTDAVETSLHYGAGQDVGGMGEDQMNISRRRPSRVPWLIVGIAAAVTAGSRVRKKPASSPTEAPGAPGASVREKLSGRVAQAIDNTVAWDKLPWPVATVLLRSLRGTMRRQTLFDPAALPTVPPQAPGPGEWTPELSVSRSPDGSFNDLTDARMGMRGMRFGRNVPIGAIKAEVPPALFDPNPRTVSRELLTRREFIPAPSLNLLAAAWLQFMVKDWFSHGEGQSDLLWEIEIDPSYPWPAQPLTILKTLPD